MAGDTHPWRTTLLNAVFDMAFRVATEMKHFFAMPRPDELSPDIAPAIRTPSHGAFPSGHATEAFAAAAVLSALYPTYTQHLREMAARIAMNRCFAGVHFAVDQYAGAMLGDVLGGIAVQRALRLNPFSPSGMTPSFSATKDPTSPGVTSDTTVEKFAQGSPILGLKSGESAPTTPPAPTGVLAQLGALVFEEK
jgi:membrane-associated phospholipid phosphatase